MRQLRGFVILARAAALIACSATLIACASQPPATSAGNVASHGSVPATAAAAPQKKKFEIPPGYRRVVQSGEERFCRTETVTGSRTERLQVCLTRAQLEAEQQSGQGFIQNVQRQSGFYSGTGGAFPSGGPGGSPH